MEPPKFARGIGLKKVKDHWCMIKFDTNAKTIVTLPLFYKIEPKKLSSPIRACSSIDGEFIWVYGMGGGNLFVGCIRKKGVWESNSNESAIGLVSIKTTNGRINSGQNSHYAWVTENGNFCITNESRRYFHEMDNEDDYKPDLEVYQISPNYDSIEGEYILTDHRNAKKIIGRFEFNSYNNNGSSLNHRRMRCKSFTSDFENVWECPFEMDYVVEYPDPNIESDES
jgi:hypothetical protein